MTHGILLKRSTLSTKLDSRTNRGGLFIEIITAPSGTSDSRSYPRVPAGALYFHTAQAGGHRVTIDTDANGAARLNWVATGSGNVVGSILYVFARKVLKTALYGIAIKNSLGESLLDFLYPVPQFAGTVTLNATAQGSYVTPEGYTAYTHVTPAFNLRPGSDKMVLMAMPDVGTDDTWYCLQNEAIPAGSNSATVTVTVYTKAGSYVIPTLHVYAINGLQPSNALYGIRVKTPQQAITFDAGGEYLYTTDVLTVSYPAPGASPNVYALSQTNLPGLAVPYYYRNVQSGQNTTRYAGVSRRVGSQLSLKLLTDFQSANAIPDNSYEKGSQINRYCPLADVSYFNPGTQNGVPGGTTLTAPAFTSQPGSITREPGQTATFSVAASGNPVPSYQWYRDTGMISGATSQNYSFVCGLGDNNATFRCIASNSRGDTASYTATLTVANAPPPIDPVRVTSDPQPVTVTAGDMAQFSITVSGTAPVSAQWYRDGSYIPGATGFSYSFMTSTADSGSSFSCQVSNGSGAYTATSRSALLTVNAPGANINIYQNPQPVTVNKGDPAYMTCQATPNGVTYNWYRDGTYVGVGSTYQLDTSVAGSFSYRCQVLYPNSTAVWSSPAILTVNESQEVPYTNHYSLSDTPTVYNGDSCEIDVYRDGSVYSQGVYLGSWGSGGTGTGTLYHAAATTNDGLEPGSDAAGQTYYFSDRGGVTFIMSGYNGGTQPLQRSLIVSIYLNSGGGAVATISINLRIMPGPQ